jgi:hypothetical protein
MLLTPMCVPESYRLQQDFNFTYKCSVLQALAKMDIKDPMRIQTYAWPAIMRGQYTVLVGPPQSGKTLAYIIPVVSLMLTPDFCSEVSTTILVGVKWLLKHQCMFKSTNDFYISLFNDTVSTVMIMHGSSLQRQCCGLWCYVNDHAGLKCTAVHVLNNNPSQFKHVHKTLCVPYFTATIEKDVIQYSVAFLNNVNCSVTKAKCLSDF